VPGGTQAGEKRIAAALIVSTLAALGLAVVYVRGAQPQLEGALLGVSFGGLGVGLILWAKYLLPGTPVVGDRETLGSSPDERAAFEASFERGELALERRTFLSRLLLGAVGALGLALLFPIRSLGPSPGRTLLTTAWAPGKRLMREDGSLVLVGDLEVGGIVTAFPEDRPDAADSQIVVVRVDPDQIRPRPGREDWSPGGYVAYSKICTHVGCPVGLYRQTTHSLLCPCHQSTFDVLDGARPIFGPATRSLPQLPLMVVENGVLAARRDFTEPVGPGYWNRG
jgi:ubiquinol-cytochrome c reductase iron-sulfur subunit